MNRRTSIKGLFAFVALGFSSFSLYKWIVVNSKINISVINEKRQLIAEMAEVIIPKTDTPGAKDAKVEDFIINVVQFCLDKRTQSNFLDGLYDVEKFTEERFGKTFVNLDSEHKFKVLVYFQEKAHYSQKILDKIKIKLVGKPFFQILKELTVEGYCNSQIGATQGLVYDHIPSTYQACIPLLNNQKSWATK